jgi:hypothetical protein
MGYDFGGASDEYNRAEFGHMSLGGYMAYLASDELSSRWLSRSNIDPAMDLPGKPNNIFVTSQIKGLPQYDNLMRDVIRTVLYEAGYNHSQKPYKYRTRRGYEINEPLQYIYEQRYGGWGSYWKTHQFPMDGKYPPSYSGTRIAMVKNEIREEVTQKCLEKVASGESVIFGAGRWGTLSCESLGNNIDMSEQQQGFTPKNAYEQGLIEKGTLISWQNLENPSSYHEPEERDGWEVTDRDYTSIQKKGLVVRKVGELSTAETNKYAKTTKTVKTAKTTTKKKKA